MANDNQIAVKKRLIYAEDLFEPVDATVLMVSVGGRSGGKTMAMYEALFRKRVEMAPTIDAVVLPCNVGDKLLVDAKALPTEKIDLDAEDIPEYFRATVVSIRMNTKGWFIKFSVRAPWLVWIRDDECGPYEEGVDCMRYFTVPASAIGKTVFLDDRERRDLE